MNRRSLVHLLLALAAGLLAPEHARAGQVDVQRLEVEFRAAYDAKDWPTAIDRGLALTAAQPEAPEFAYNLACVHALAGQHEPALKWLGRSVELGFADGELLRTDPDLDGLRGTQGFERVLADWKSRALADSGEFDALLAGSEPLILLPPDHDRERPATVIVALHGYGVDAADIASTWHGPAAEIGAVLVAPRAVRRAEGTEGYTWGPLEEAERIVLRSLELARGKLAVDPGRVVLTGFSQGAYASLCLAARHPGLFRGVIAVGAFYRPEEAPFPPAAEGRTPRFCLLIGDQDRSYESNRAAVRALEERGYPVELTVFEGLGHAFPPEPAVVLHRALHSVLDGPPERP